MVKEMEKENEQNNKCEEEKVIVIDKESIKSDPGIYGIWEESLRVVNYIRFYMF